jgi:hypothetical protein
VAKPSIPLASAAITSSQRNPALTVRRVLDELMQLDDNLYLGKAHVRWWWQPAGSWQTVAFFTLLSQES